MSTYKTEKKIYGEQDITRAGSEDKGAMVNTIYKELNNYMVWSCNAYR